MHATIINHEGSTSLLAQPAEENAQRFPFTFQAIKPEEKSWAYRLLPHGPEPMTDAELAQLLQSGRAVLRADWEEQVGHPIGLITLYLPPKNGSSQKRQARFKRGPDLEMDPPPVAPPPLDPEEPDVGKETPGRDGDDFDVSF